MAPRTAFFECVATLLLCVTACRGFTVHQRHPHHHHHHARNSGHHPHHTAAPESAVSPETAVDVAAADALYEALLSAELSDAAWGSGADDEAPGVPLFMKLLLHDTEEGAVFGAYTQPVAPQPAGSNKTLASGAQPSRVSVGRAGALVVEFPRDDGDDSDDRGWWLVLALRTGYVVDVADDTVLSVFAAGDGGVHDLKLVAEHTLPNATFVAVDVTKAVRETVSSRPRFVVDVRARPQPPTDAHGGQRPSGAAAATAAAALEVAGWERGPLLVSALNWGEDTSDDGSMRVWKELPEVLLHPPRPRSRRRSHRRTTTTEAPAAYSSAENPLRNAATAELTPHSGEQGADEVSRVGPGSDSQFCHLETWTVSLHDLGWEFVVAPRSIDINFCVGKCPTMLLDLHFNASTNAIARTAIKRERGAAAGANIPDAQCVPIRYKPITLLMQAKDKVDVFVSYDLSADRCGCR